MKLLIVLFSPPPLASSLLDLDPQTTYIKTEKTEKQLKSPKIYIFTQLINKQSPHEFTYVHG
jgi:hypothetical protein